MRQLVAAFIHHFVVAYDEPIFYRVVIKLGSRVSMRNRNLNGLHIKFFGKRDGVVDGLAGFAGQSHDEVAVNHKPKLVTIFRELPRPFDGRALLDVFQNLLIAGFITHDEQAASRFLHRL